MKLKQCVIGSFVGMTALVLSVATLAQPPIVLKFSHVVTDATPKGRGALKFKELAESRTKGRVRIDVYSNSSRFKDTDEIRALELGAVQILAPSLSKFSPLGITEFEVFDLPYLFDSYRELRKITDGAIGKGLLGKLEPKGIIGLAYWDNGFKVMSANRPLHNPADFKGIKLRIQDSKVIESQMRALGATPQPIPFSEVRKALETGVVDGTENPPSNLYSQKMHEVQKHVTVSNHGYLGYAVIVNKKFWETLPSDVREQLEGAMKDATLYVNEMTKKENDDALEAVQRSGKSRVYRLTAEEKQLWKKTLMGVHRDQERRIGKDLIQSIYKETGFDPNKL